MGRGSRTGLIQCRATCPSRAKPPLCPGRYNCNGRIDCAGKVPSLTELTLNVPNSQFRIAVLTTPAGLLTTHYLVKHLPVAGVIIDRGAWRGSTAMTPYRKLRRVARHTLNKLRPHRDPYARARAAETAYLRTLDQLYFGQPHFINDTRSRTFTTWEVLARDFNVPLVHVENINSDEAAKALGQWRVDLAVVAGGRIIKPEIYNIPRLGTLNKHSSLLPKHRGLAAEYWCLYHNDLTSLGVTVHFLQSGADTGPIVLQRQLSFRPGDTPTSLRHQSEWIGREAIVEAVRLVQTTGTRGQPQDESLATSNGKPTRATDRQLKQALPKLWQAVRDAA